MTQKPVFILKGIDILKSFDMSYIAFLEKKHSDRIRGFYQRLPRSFQNVFAKSIWDQTVCSSFRNLLSQYARAQFIAA